MQMIIPVLLMFSKTSKMTGYSGHVADSLDSMAQIVDQNAINRVMLDQLTALGDRLDKLERQNVKAK